ncbi:transporter substrate-binding domain-containing protein [Pseudoduganella sp. LjRoot289]|uniref:substrate-binding periplasmic protein n=1 Tax=Pseudoduganella sp. LjRoot289 TaxID=3342314 RepID=UPI003ED0C010
MFWKSRLIRSIGLCYILLGSAGAAELTVYTEESAPYHFTQDGRVVGIATDMLRLACERAKLDCIIRMMPWARAYAQTLQTPNTLIYSMVRNPAREKDFLWISPIATESMWIYGRPDSPEIKSIADLKTMRTGVINGSSGLAFLQKAGVPASAMDLANSTELNFRKLAADRIQFLVSTESRMQTELTRFELPFAIAKRIKLQDATTYFAMNRQSDPALVRALRQALASVASDKAMGEIKAKYQAK